MSCEEWCQDFPLLGLQPLVLKTVLENSNCKDVIRFALSGNDARNQAIHTKPANIREAWFYFGTSCDLTLIDERTTDNSQRDIYWSFFKGERLSEEEIRRKAERRAEFRRQMGIVVDTERMVVGQEPIVPALWKESVIVDDQVLRIECLSHLTNNHRYMEKPYGPHDTCLCTVSRDKIESFQLAVAFLSELFRPPKSVRVFVDLDIHPNFMDLLDSEFAKNVTSFKMHKFEAVVTRTELDFVLCNFPKLETLNVKSCVSSDAIEGLKFKLNNLLMQISTLELKHLQNMDCVYLTIGTKFFKFPHFNTIVTAWVNGGLSDRLKSLQMDVGQNFQRERDADFEKRPVLETVKYRVGDLVSINWATRGAELFDVIRRDNGKRATVCNHEHYYYLYVWD